MITRVALELPSRLGCNRLLRNEGYRQGATGIGAFSDRWSLSTNSYIQGNMSGQRPPKSSLKAHIADQPESINLSGN